MIFFTFLLSTHLIFSFFFGSFPALANNTSSMVDEVAVSENIQNIIKSILFLRDPLTNISPSHWNHPGYEKLAFTYDKAVDALVLEASGYQSEAEQILDYFITRLDIPIGEVCLGADTNDVYGILKLFKSSSSPEKVFKSFVNALDITSLRTQGRGRLEFWTTPGPISFMIFAMLKVNAQKYKNSALYLGEVLLAMQRADGGVYDGDRAPDKVHTEPHMDGYSAFLMLYQISGDKKWQKAADAAYGWFESNVYHAQEGLIDQGVWSGFRNPIFAEDVYSWTMAGPAGDRISPLTLKKMTKNMLKKSLVRIRVNLPDKRTVKVALCDFSDPELEEVKRVRGGFHPMGSVEWTGGAILALQKNAVRFYKDGDIETAKFFKAIAEILFSEIMKCFYYLEDIKGKITFYATGQGVEIAPFGSISRELVSGWKTPYFYIDSPESNEIIKGGSLVGAWPILPYLGVNPFILNDRYKETYRIIKIKDKDLENAEKFILEAVNNREFVEIVPKDIPDAGIQIVEPELFNQKMWEAFKKGYSAKSRKDLESAKSYFNEAMYWARLVVEDQEWINLAKRDNVQKEGEFGGLIWYPWGTVYNGNNNFLHTAILRYPLLNEIGAAMWGLATVSFELGNNDEAKYWIKRIIEDVPLHQIPNIVEGNKERSEILINGYWNALVSWEDNPGEYERDTQMKELYIEVMKEKGGMTAKPKNVFILR